MNLNQVNWEAGSNILHPIVNLTGIQSASQLTPKEINKRFAVIRNNEKALANAVTAVAKKADAVTYLSEITKSFSDIIYENTFKYDAETIIARSRNSNIKFTQTHVSYHIDSVITNSIESDTITLVFIDGLLLDSVNYTIDSLNGSTVVYIKSNLITVDTNVSFIIFRKFNEYGKTLNSRSQYVLTDNITSSSNFSISRNKEDFGILFSLEHIQIFNATTNKLLQPTDYTVVEDKDNLNNIDIFFKIDLPSGTILQFYNSTEYGKGVVPYKGTASKLIIDIRGSDNKILPHVNTKDIYLWINGIHVNNKYIETIINTNQYSIDLKIIPELVNVNSIPVEQLKVVAFKISTTNVTSKLNTFITIPTNYFTNSEVLEFPLINNNITTGISITTPMLITQKGIVCNSDNYKLSHDGRTLTFYHLEDKNSPINIRQSVLVSDAYADVFNDVIETVVDEQTADYEIINAVNIAKSMTYDSNLNSHVKLVSPGSYTLTNNTLYDIETIGNYLLTLPLNKTTVRIKPTVENVTYTVMLEDTVLLTSSEDVIFYWNDITSKWEYTIGNGIYIYLAAISLTEINSNIEDFFTKRNHQSTLERIDISLDQNINTIKELINKIKVLESKLLSGSGGGSSMNWLMDNWNRISQDEYLRGNGGSGVFNVRNYSVDTGFNPKYRPFDVAYSAMTMHTHSNFFNTLGLGEIAAIINGYLIRTTHNDPWLTYSVDGAKGIDGVGTSGNIDMTGAALPPALPPEINSRPTGVTFNSETNKTEYTYEDVSGNLTQAEFFRNMFSNNEYLKHCRWDLSYLEIAIEKIGTGGRLFNYASSARHNQTGSTLQMLLLRASYMAAAGLKNINENDSFRSGFTVIDDEEGNPVFAHVNYRMRVKSVGTPAIQTKLLSENDIPPTIFLGEANGTSGLHPHYFDNKRYDLGGRNWQALSLTVEQANIALATPNTKIKLTTSVDHGHSHIIEVWHDGNTWRAIDSKVFTASGTEVEGHKHPVKISVPTSNIPFDLKKAVDGIIDNTNKFILVRDISQMERFSEDATWLDLAVSNKARFRLGDGILEELCESCFGFEGEGSFLTDNMELPLSTNYSLRAKGTAAPLNAAKYNREYTMGMADASNRGSAPRGFNDPTLFIAKTTNKNIINGYSYMIPLELVLRTPLEVWNPYKVSISPGNTGLFTRQTKTNPNGQATYFGGYYLSPVGLYSTSSGSTDVADTGGNIWILAENKKAVLTESSGVTITKDINNPAGEAIYKDSTGGDFSNTVRFRYPVYPVYHEYTYEHIQSENLKSILKRALKSITEGTLTVNDIDNLF